MQLSCGEVGVECSRGDGSTFWFTQPLAETQQVEATEGLEIAEEARATCLVRPL